MSEKYIPLYTKYRPAVFADITGQTSTVKALSNAVNSGKIAHAYLFCGPRGTGKTSTARILAKSLNCEKGPTVTPCGKCPACLDVINSTPVDVTEIDAAGNRSVEDARNILDKVRYAPVYGKYKIYIIDEVHMLTTEASNTLLKTLEEPPQNVVFILATTEAHKVLDTVISRCQRYDFKRITVKDIVQRLAFIAKKENISADESALAEIAKNSAGGLRDAIALLDRLSVIGKTGKITSDDVNEILGKLSFDKLFDLTENIISGNCEQTLILLNEIYDNGNEPGRIISNLIQYLRDILILKSTSDKELVFSATSVNEFTYDKIFEQSEKISSAQILYMTEKLSEHYARVKETTDKYLQTQLCFIDLANTPKIPSLSELAKKVEILEEKINSGNFEIVKNQQEKIANKPVTKPFEHKPELPAKEEIKKAEIITNPEPAKSERETAKKVTPVEASEKTSVSFDDDWKNILSKIEKIPSRMFFTNLARPVEITKEKIILAFSNEAAVKQAEDSGKKNPLENAAKEYFGVDNILIEIKVKSADLFKKKITNDNIVSHETKEFEETVSESDFVPEEEFEEDEAYYNSLGKNEPEKAAVPEDASDTVENIINLFDGKIIN